MAIKKKMNTPPEVKIKKKFKRYARRGLYLVLIVAAYFFLLPKLVPSTAPKVEETKTSLLTIYSDAGTHASKILGAATKMADNLGINKEEFINQTPEQFVESKVQEIKAKLGSLPQEQALIIKKQFCQDLVEEAKIACEPTPTQ